MVKERIYIEARFCRGNRAFYQRQTCSTRMGYCTMLLDEDRIESIKNAEDLTEAFRARTLYRLLDQRAEDLDRMMIEFDQNFCEMKDLCNLPNQYMLKTDYVLTGEELAAYYVSYRQDIVNQEIFLGELELYGTYSELKSFSIRKTRFDGAKEDEIFLCEIDFLTE